MLVGINLHRDENLLKILLAGGHTSLLPVRGITAPIHGGQNKDDEDGNEQFDERKGIGPTSFGRTGAELPQRQREICLNA